MRLNALGHARYAVHECMTDYMLFSVNCYPPLLSNQCNFLLVPFIRNFQRSQKNLTSDQSFYFENGQMYLLMVFDQDYYVFLSILDI